jgi:sarcosine oxidase, subunit gamma
VSEPDTGNVQGHYGVPASAVTLAEISIAVAWNVQGDPAHAPLLAAARRCFGVELPLVPNTTTRGEPWTALWLGPTSWLLVAHAASSEVPQLAAFTEGRDSLNAVGGALFDLSASRIAFEIGGKHAASVLAKACPLDFHISAFPAGHCAQSLLGHVNALIFRPEATPAFTVMAARSFASDVWRSLRLSSAQYGYDVVSGPNTKAMTGP